MLEQKGAECNCSRLSDDRATGADLKGLKIAELSLLEEADATPTPNRKALLGRPSNTLYTKESVTAWRFAGFTIPMYGQRWSDATKTDRRLLPSLSKESALRVGAV